MPTVFSSVWNPPIADVEIVGAGVSRIKRIIILIPACHRRIIHACSRRISSGSAYKSHAFVEVGLFLWFWKFRSHHLPRISCSSFLTIIQRLIVLLFRIIRIIFHFVCGVRPCTLEILFLSLYLDSRVSYNFVNRPHRLEQLFDRDARISNPKSLQCFISLIF